ncbi:MAG: ribonuclease HII [Nitrospinaceae bacterium]|nr:ribonuclease HII [Nitrospinaceae bacterium]|tara:strand:- start:4075 stop:4671 length:597 start_codon:yes stop_codon:yes gene_type:complete
MFAYETAAKAKGYQTVAGVDEAGRGPLAGPVVAAAVLLAPDSKFNGLDDSKKLSPKIRENFFLIIKEQALSYGIGIVDVEKIEKINILQASLLAMKHAVENLSLKPDLLLIDGNQAIDTDIKQWTIVKGDSLSQSIAAASVLAKVTRDKLMEQYHEQFPQYAFNKHKGYGTSLHRDLIKKYGPCPIHRRTFKGVCDFI